ncbi:hypothetical protein B1B_11634, partial [mine drainage metagenome]
MTTRRQHYVWRKYLEPWTTLKGRARQIWCLRRESAAPINPGIKNVAVERDFYRLRDLEQGDVEFVRTMGISPNTNPRAKRTNEGWISKFETFFGLYRALKNRARSDPQQLIDLDN